MQYRLAPLTLVFAVACGDPGGSGALVRPDAAATDAGAMLPVDTGPDVAPLVPPAERCVPQGQVSRAPRSITEVLALINALPRPLGLPCFLSALDRPLEVNATFSIISLQPAVGMRSPRVFIFSGPLIMSVVPEGRGGMLLELAETVEMNRSLKGEIKFPVTREVVPADPYTQVKGTGTGTTCRFCHANEQRAAHIDYAEAFVSDALKPEYRTRVDVDFMARERITCDGTLEPHRCAMLGGLFDYGPVTPREFPESVPTIFR